MLNKKAFTLIELMIVVAIIAILATIAVVQYQKYLINGRDSATREALHHLALAQMGYNVDHQSFTTSWSALGKYGFRPNRDIRYDGITIGPISVNGERSTGFSARACHRVSPHLFKYDLGVGSGVMQVVGGNPTSLQNDAYKVKIHADGSVTGPAGISIP